MHADHIWLKTDAEGRLIDPPVLPPCSRIEAILLLGEVPNITKSRVPPAALAAITKIRGDLIEPAVSQEDWDSLL